MNIHIRIKEHIKARNRYIFVIVIVLLLLGLYGVLHKKDKGNVPVSNTVAAVEAEELDGKRAIEENLREKDYDSYQYSKFNYAAEYILGGDYEKATQILDEIEANVPADKLSTDIYIHRAKIAKAEGKKAEYKKSLDTLIVKLKAENRKPEAQYYEQKLQEENL